MARGIGSICRTGSRKAPKETIEPRRARFSFCTIFVTNKTNRTIQLALHRGDGQNLIPPSWAIFSTAVASGKAHRVYQDEKGFTLEKSTTFNASGKTGPAHRFPCCSWRRFRPSCHVPGTVYGTCGGFPCRSKQRPFDRHNKQNSRLDLFSTILRPSPETATSGQDGSRLRFAMVAVGGGPLPNHSYV